MLTDYRPVSIHLCNEISSGTQLTNDEVSTAIARAAKKGESIAIDCRRERLSAGSYFAGHGNIPKTKIIETYVEGEQVFPDEKTTNTFLDIVGRNPKDCSFITFAPEIDPHADVILLIIRAAQLSKLLGLSGYLGKFHVDCIPAAPTCAALFRPLMFPDRIHINCIDYFDREYQAKGCFERDEMIAGMDLTLYRNLQRAYPVSGHGKMKPNDLPIY